MMLCLHQIRVKICDNAASLIDIYGLSHVGKVGLIIGVLVAEEGRHDRLAASAAAAAAAAAGAAATAAAVAAAARPVGTGRTLEERVPRALMRTPLPLQGPSRSRWRFALWFRQA